MNVRPQRTRRGAVESWRGQHHAAGAIGVCETSARKIRSRPPAGDSVQRSHRQRRTGFGHHGARRVAGLAGHIVRPVRPDRREVASYRRSCWHQAQGRAAHWRTTVGATGRKGEPERVKGAVMLTSDFFEDLLATDPAEKRELARQVYCRFAEGDSMQFFTQLFLVLDIYAHYAERVPQAGSVAHKDTHANFDKPLEENGLLAPAADSRDINITKQPEVT